MCGIAGLIALDNRASNSDPTVVAQEMVDALAHRGPDGRDAWGDPQAGIGLGHRRLAVVDLTDTGKQPMHSADDRFVITYNGEVYNFPELRIELAALGHSFRGTSDTEVMLTAFMQWGVEQAVTRFLGMFAFALFDRRNRSLHLVRDRLGVKPLYWAVFDNTLLFGSELRALMAHPLFRKDVNREAVAATIEYSYVPTPATIFQNVFKLPAGCILTARSGQAPAIAPYWRLLDHVGEGPEKRTSFDDAAAQIHDLLRDAVKQRLIADVPVGAFLSGGTDSSTVVALMQSVSAQPVRTFTVGFGDGVYDESRHAAQVAKHLGTDHTAFDLAPDTALELVDQIPNWFDEPFGDSSQLPTYLVSRMTREHVTVALSGDGGDELFAGYPKYAMLSQAWKAAAWLPSTVRRPLAAALTRMPDRFADRLGALVLEPGRAKRTGEKVRRLGAALAAASFDDAALAVAKVGVDGRDLTRSGTLALERPSGVPARLPDLISRMQVYDTLNYLPDDILTKVDRCSMAVALEAREPLLDHRLVELVWSLPPDIRRARPGSKSVLRAVLARYLPQSLIDVPKRGFSIPLTQWLAGPLRPWAEDLLSADALQSAGLFDPAPVRRLWDRQMSGIENNATGLWNVLMVCAWSKRWLCR